MDQRRRLALLRDAALLDRDGAVGITQVRVPGRGTTNLMRVMQTNACSLSCGYCPTFCGGKVRRTALAAEEVARTFMDAHRAGLAQGLFLTSGVPGRAVRATDRMLTTLAVLRERERFDGYIHIKLLPGAEPAQVDEAARLASRISVNLEGPSDAYVRQLAREKDFSGDLLPKLERAGRIFRDARHAHAAMTNLDRPWRSTVTTNLDRPWRSTVTTQFVVGAVGERDREILDVVARLERQELLHHAHFSAFQPVVGTPMEGRPPTPARRELRLYQAEHLLRDYGFRFDELTFGDDGNLSLDHDPKTAWALAHPEHFPLEVMRAPRELLLRVPGIGPLASRRLVAARRQATLRFAGDLRGIGVDVVRAGWFLTLRGRRLAEALPPQQFRLFAHGQHLTQAPYATPVPPCAYR